MNTERTGDLVKQMTPIDRISQLPDIEYSDEVIQLSERATEYLSAFPWCEKIIDGWLDRAYGYIIGVFYFQIRPSKETIPQFVWIIVGDLPPAYIDAETCLSGVEALAGYIGEMQEWVDRVSEGHPIDNTVIPVNVPPEREWADRLNRRLSLLRKYILEEQDSE